MCIKKKTFHLVLLSMDNIHNDITINNTGVPVWGRKRWYRNLVLFILFWTWNHNKK